MMRGDGTGRRIDCERAKHRHSTHQQQHHNESNEQPRSRRHRPQVDFRAGDDEENRNEETVSDGVQLVFQRFVAFRNDVAQHEARGECA